MTNEPVDAPAVLGGVSIWVCRSTDLDSAAGFKAAVKHIVNSCSMQVTNRRQCHDQYKMDYPNDRADGPFISVDIYVPAKLLTPERREFIEKSIEENAKHNYQAARLPRKLTHGDSLRLKNIKDAPPCEGCGLAVQPCDY